MSTNTFRAWAACLSSLNFNRNIILNQEPRSWACILVFYVRPPFFPVQARRCRCLNSYIVTSSHFSVQTFPALAIAFRCNATVKLEITPKSCTYCRQRWRSGGRITTCDHTPSLGFRHPRKDVVNWCLEFDLTWPLKRTFFFPSSSLSPDNNPMWLTGLKASTN